MTNILFIVTSADKMGDRPTGFHASEFAVPYYHLAERGARITVASPKGGRAPMDPSSLEGKQCDEVKRMLRDSTLMNKVNGSKKLSEIDFDQFDAIFFPGGHGAVVDLPSDAVLAQKLGRAYGTGVVIGAVCHGPGGLLGAKAASGKPIIAGKRVNSFTDAEERAISLENAVPFLLETRMKELGGVFEGGEDFGEYAVRDGRIVTGQNPASARKCAELILEALNA